MSCEECEYLKGERDKALAWVRSITNTNILTCVYCGHAYPPGTPSHGADVLTEHISQCEKHPIRPLSLEVEFLRAENSRLKSLLEKFEKD